RLDAVVVNLHDTIGSASGQFVVCTRDGCDEVLPPMDKNSAAARIVATTVQLWQARATP
ncbi:MAG: hypothetical protein JNK15_19810, partial [Planctomycetes bacterium]|nr:hypothetical protein [Planctomycetota bacterium]